MENQGVIHLPVNRRQIDNHVDHIATHFVVLHVDWRTVRRNVDFRNNVEEKRFFNSRVLKKKENYNFLSNNFVPPNLTETKMFSKFSSVGNCGINFCTTLENASKIEWS